MGLRHGVAGEMLAPVVVVALPARQVELALALVERAATLVDERLKPRIVVGCERQQSEHEGEARARIHSTVIFAEASWVKPLSPVHWNAKVPLSVATVWKVMNGLAAMAW